MNDPTVTLYSLSSELGISISSLRAWARDGYIPRNGKGTTTLIAAMQGILRAVRDEAADRTPYEVKPIQIEPGFVKVSEVMPALDRIAAAFDAALVDAIKTTQSTALELSAPAVTTTAGEIKANERARAALIASRRRAAGYSADVFALLKKRKRP